MIEALLLYSKEFKSTLLVMNYEAHIELPCEVFDNKIGSRLVVAFQLGHCYVPMAFF